MDLNNQVNEVEGKEGGDLGKEGGDFREIATIIQSWIPLAKQLIDGFRTISQILKSSTMHRNL